MIIIIIIIIKLLLLLLLLLLLFFYYYYYKNRIGKDRIFPRPANCYTIDLTLMVSSNSACLRE